MCERPVGSFTPVWVWVCVGGAGIISRLSQTVRHALTSGVCRGRVAWHWMPLRPSSRTGVCYSLFFLSVVWIEPLPSREWASLPQRWLEAAPLAGVFHNKRALMKKVQPVAECRAFDRPVNRYKWFNTLGHFSRCWGASLFAVPLLAFILFWSK